MNVLFVHNNYPAQFRHLAAKMAADGGNRMAAIGCETARATPGIDLRKYITPGAEPTTHTFARRLEAESRRAEQVMFAALRLRDEGFEPDLMLGHCGWGETLPLRSVFPQARLAVYCEYYYRPEGGDVGFDTESGQFGVDGLVSLNLKNAATLIALAECELGLSPTPWQRSLFPTEFQSKIHVVHEGVDTTWLTPDSAASFTPPGGPRLTRQDEVITFFARSLEPMRGFHIFMRALPAILQRRPQAHVVVVGGEAVSYGANAPDGGLWKSYCLREVLPGLDMSRVHLLDFQPHAGLRALMQISTVHVYLTYPFVLSWSCIEAMACGCAIVASDTSPVRDVIKDGDNGVLVPFHDHLALAEAITDLAADPERRARFAVTARETATSEYDLRDCVRRTLSILGYEEPSRETPAGLVPAAVGS